MRQRINISLPTILYTNCRSCNQWKLEELNAYSETQARRYMPYRDLA